MHGPKDCAESAATTRTHVTIANKIDTVMKPASRLVQRALDANAELNMHGPHRLVGSLLKRSSQVVFTHPRQGPKHNTLRKALAIHAIMNSHLSCNPSRTQLPSGGSRPDMLGPIGAKGELIYGI